MKKSKFSCLLLVSLLVIVTALMSASLVACNKNKTPAPVTGPEGGSYYYDAGHDEYTVVLGEGTQFTLAIADKTIAGSYTLNNEGVLTLKSNKADEGEIAAVLKDDVIILNYNDAEYRFLKKINYTVTFDSNAGSAVSSATVVNGKKVAKPSDPNKDGYIFVGWYADADFATPFSFNSQMITADTTLYARWVEKQVDGVEFVASFDAAGGNCDIESKTTVGGKLFTLPEVEREGYTFKGWWVSMNNDGVLSYEVKDGDTLDANTTLIALWQSNNLGSKLADPIITVSANAIRWEVAGARSYVLSVQGPDGNFVVDNENLSANIKAFDFYAYPAGDYTVTVKAIATSGGEANNSVATRLYKNKALTRVSQFSVIEPSMLLYNAVDNAQKYIISVDCGDKNHNHSNFDNGASTHFNFADCQMQNGGIKFTVTAVADGYASSVSQTFVYAPTLDAVSDFEFDAKTQKLVWNEVANAMGYTVAIKCGEYDVAAEDDGFIYLNTTSNSVNLKECPAIEGGIIVNVTPVSQMYISPDAMTYTFDKQNLATPRNIRINGTTVSWTAVDGAKSYEVRIAGAVLTTNTNSIDLAGRNVTLSEKEYYKLTVVAMGDSGKDSVATDEIDARNLAMADTLKYENSTLSWAHVIGAAYYDVQINDEAVFSVSNGENFANIDLTKAGENTLKVRFVSAEGTAFEWVSTSVYAHTLTLISDGGSSVAEQYKAVGDAIDLPMPSKVGYEFLDWYNTSKGPESNGAAYNDSKYGEVGDLVLYACYTPKAYKVTYHYGEGGNGVAIDDSVYYQKDYQLYVPQANEATTAFGGWFSAPNGNGVQYTDDKGNSLAAWNRTTDSDAYAFWFEDVLSFTKTSIGGKDVYGVMQGSRISQVTEVTIPATYKGVNVGMVSGNAFKGCSNLTTINIPSTVELISDVDPFTDCSSLEAINVYDVEGVNASRYWSADGVLFDNGNFSESAQARAIIKFMPLAKTGSYTIPDGIVEIPRLAFENSKLTRVVIPSSVTTIGMQAFKKCENLSTIVFDTGSTQELTIGDCAFEDCTALITITLPARLASISLGKYELLSATGSPASQAVSLTTGITNAFNGCKNLEDIFVAGGSKNYKAENGVLYTADGTTLLYAFRYSKLDGEGVLNVPVGVTTIANGAFIDNRSLKKLVLPSTVTTIGECAFYGTDNYLGEVIFGGNGFNDVTIGKYAFRDCDDLETVTFEEGNRVTTIGEGAFYGCRKLDKMELPANIQTIGVQAFRGCNYLTELVISASNKNLTFGSDALYECSRLTTLTLPKNVSELPGIFSGCTSLKEVIVDEDNPYFTSDAGILYDKNKTVILFYPQSKADTELELPDSLRTISDGVFRGNSKIEKVTIGKNVEIIGNDAFRDCDSLSEVVFTEGDNGAATLEIGAYAFYGCDSYSFRSFTLPARTTKVGEYAFAEMRSLLTFNMNEGLEEIGDYMLYDNWRIYELNIPSTVKTIGAYAFYYNAAYDDELEVTFAEGSQLKSIGESAFERTMPYSSGTFEIILPEGLESIGYRAFYNSGFTDITIPKTVKIIDSYAFASNRKLKTVTFEKGGTEDLILGTKSGEYDNNGKSLEGYVFNGCSNLESIEIPARTTVLGNYAFYSCSSLASVTFEEGSRLKSIGASAFDGIKITEITIPKSVANGNVVVDAKGTTEFRIGIGASALASCSSLETVNFEAGGTEPLSIGDGAFYYNKIATLNLPSRIADYTDVDGNVVRGISERTFAVIYNSGSSTSNGQSSSSTLTAVNIEEGGAYCSVDGIIYTADKSVLIMCPAGITGKVTVPSTVSVIAYNAFANGNLSEIEFAGGTVDMVIEGRAFYGCKNLTEVVLSDNVAEIAKEAFGYCQNLVSFTLSAKMTSFDSEIFKNTNIKYLNVSDNSSEYKSIKGVMFSKDGKTLVKYPATLDDEEYEIPAGVTKIADNAFNGNSNIKSVVFPAGLKEIGESAFYLCSSLTDVTIPKSVEIIGKNAFMGCRSIANVTFEKGGTEALAIEYGAFSSTAIKAIDLPARVVAIGETAFSNCSLLETFTFKSGSQLDTIGSRAFYNDTSLKSIVLPNSLTAMGDGVFMNCSSLTSATFSEGLIEIGSNTFSGCTSLESMAFPASLSKMGAYTFSVTSGSDYCSSLKSVTFAQGSQIKTLPEGTFYHCTALERFIVPANVTTIESPLWNDNYGSPEGSHYGVFQGCTGLKGVTFEDGSKCKQISNYAFYGCSSLEAFSIPTSVSTLGAAAFSGCESIKEIVIPSTCAVYGANLFKGCKSLERVTLNEKATALSNSMFHGCESLKSLNIPASVTSFGDFLFYGTGFETFTVPSTITELPRYFLANCKSLVSVVLPENLTLINDSAFDGCVALESITIPNKVVEIQENAFRDCSKLAELSMTDSVEIIGQYAFEGCESLKDLVLSNSIMTLNRNVFAGCTALETIKLPSALESMDSTAFDDCNSIKSFAMDNGGNDYFKVIDDILYNGAVTAIVNVPAAKSGALVLPNTITNIASYAFAGTGISKITLPETMTVIGSYSFAGATELKEIVILGKVTKIGSYAFQGCTSLSKITLPNTVVEIGSYVFANCTSLEEIVLPANLTSIGSNAFQNCTGLKSIAIPNGVTSLMRSTFSGCTNLESVTLPAMLKSFNSSAFEKCPKLAKFEMDGEGTVYRVIGGVVYSYDTDSNGNVRLTLTAIPSAMTGTLALPKELYSASSSVFSTCTGLSNFTMESNNHNKFEVVDGALYSISGDSVTLVSVPAMKSGTLNLPKNLASMSDSSFKDAIVNCNAITAYAIEDGEGDNYKVIDGVLYQKKTSYYSGDYMALASVPAGMTGTYVIPEFITGRNISDYAFMNSHLDMIMFGGDANSAVEASTGYAKWLQNATTVKGIVISDGLEIGYTSTLFSTWTSEQTIYFTESEEEAKAKYGDKISFNSLSAKVVFNYVIPVEEETPEGGQQG